MTAVSTGANGAAPGELDLATVFAALPATAVFAADAPRFTVLAASDALLEVSHRPREAVVGRPLAEAFPNASSDDPGASGAADLRASLEAAVRTGAPQRMARQRYDLQRPDGAWEARYWDAVNIPVRGPDGLVRCVLHQTEDVTARVRGEAARARAEHQAGGILARIADAYIVLDRDFRFVDVNAAAERSMQKTRAELLGRSHWEVFPASHDIDAGRNYRRAAEERIELHFTEHYRYEGYDVHLEMDAYPTDEGGVAVFWRDVTERVRARREVERLLAESERARAEVDAANAQLQDQQLELELANQQLQDNAAEVEAANEELQATARELEERTAAAEDASRRTEAVLGSIADAFYLVDRQWRFTHVNDAAEPLLQTTREALLGRTLWEAFPDVAGSVFEGPYREAMATGRPTSAEAYFAPLGTWFDVHSYPWAGGLMVHFRDIGERKAAEAERERLLAEVQAAREVAEAASRAKSDFLAVMSHELRTPLNAIGGYAELIELGIRGPVTEQQREDLARIQRSQRALLGLINEVLNYARLETGAVTYDLADVLVAEAVGAAEVLVSPQLRAKGLGYGWAGGDPGLAVRADRDKLQQILLNLLSNAIKFTNARPGLPGRVEVSCEAVDGRVLIRVHDTGVGIPTDKLGAVFEPFVQVDARLTRTTEGTGLGLAISRDLARGMGGELTAESEVGVGSTFTLTLPAAG